MNYKTLDTFVTKTTQPIIKKLEIHHAIREKLHSFYVSNRIPHIIFYGSSGSGKQTIVYDFLKEIYHPTLFFQNSKILIPWFPSV